MTATEDRPTVGERYSSAVESSNLKLGERRGDVDLIIAAGLVPDGLASTLFRLQVEYDGVRADHRAAELNMRNRENEAKRQTDDPASKEGARTAAQKSETIMRDAEHAALMDHVLILSQLTSLRSAKELFGEFAMIESARRRQRLNAAAVLVLAGRVLDVFLSPTCRHCEGRGFNGATHRGEKQVLCRPCRGSGNRRDAIGKDDLERGFASHLLMTTDALMYQVQRDIRTNMNAIEQAKVKIAEQTGVPG